MEAQRGSHSQAFADPAMEQRCAKWALGRQRPPLPAFGIGNEEKLDLAVLVEQPHTRSHPNPVVVEIAVQAGVAQG